MSHKCATEEHLHNTKFFNTDTYPIKSGSHDRSGKSLNATINNSSLTHNYEHPMEYRKSYKKINVNCFRVFLKKTMGYTKLLEYKYNNQKLYLMIFLFCRMGNQLEKRFYKTRNHLTNQIKNPD